MIRKFTRLMLAVSMIGLSFGAMAQATDLIISEYGEGSSSNKYIEIYNGTGATVTLSNYQIWRVSNGGTWPEAFSTLSGTIADGGVLVIANSSADPAITSLANAITDGVISHNGDDALGLAKDDGTGTFVLIDAVGQDGADPGSGWDVAGTTDATANHTLVRKDIICSPDTTWTTTSGTTVANSQWVVYPSDTWTDAGVHTSTCAAPTSSDTTKPEVLDGAFLSNTSVNVVFSEPVTAATAQNLANYLITPGITITSAVLSTSMDTVSLSLSAPGFVNGTQYSVGIINVTDTSGNANIMDPFATQFYYNSYNGGDIKITEIMYGQNSSGIQDIDYFEIYNAGTASISLAGLSVSSGMDLEINSNISLAAGDYYIITEDVDSFMLAFPTVTNVIGVDGGSLSGGGETIEISNTLGDIVESVSYMTSAPWPGYTGEESIELCDLASDNTDGLNWYYAGTVSSTVADMLYGTPGSSNSCAALPFIPTYDIATIRTVDASGVLDSLGVYCAIEGIVHGVDLDGNAGLSFYIVDETHGINVFNFADVDNYVVTEGDLIRAVGEVDQYNGLSELVVDSITILSTGNCIPFATVVDSLTEWTEGNYIEFKNVMFDTSSSWPNPGSSANVNFITMYGDTFTMRIDSDTDIQDSILNAPSGLFNLTGLGGQFSFSSTLDDGYQIFPMFVTDFDTVPSTVSDLFINEALFMNDAVIADPQGEFDPWIEIYNANSTPMDLTGMYITNYTNEGHRFARCEAPVIVPANGFLLLWADAQPEDGMEHLPFKIFGTDRIQLMSKDYMTIDSLGWDSSLTDVSVGYDTDGSGVMVSFSSSTPNASNNGGIVLSVIHSNVVNGLSVYPNPTSTGNINFTKVVSFTMYSITGQTVMIQNAVNNVDVSSLENGIYIIETTEGEVVKVIVK